MIHSVYVRSFVLYGNRITKIRRISAISVQQKIIQLRIPTVEDMEDVGSVLATVMPDVEAYRGLSIFLDGDLGAGKTVFARGFVRGATADDALSVTSPTFLLSNTYTAQTSGNPLRYVYDTKNEVLCA